MIILRTLCFIFRLCGANCVPCKILKIWLPAIQVKATNWSNVTFLFRLSVKITAIVWWVFGFYKFWDHSWAAELLSACQELPVSMKYNTIWKFDVIQKPEEKSSGSDQIPVELIKNRGLLCTSKIVYCIYLKLLEVLTS